MLLLQLLIAPMPSYSNQLDLALNVNSFKEKWKEVRSKSVYWKNVYLNLDFY